MAEVKVSLTDLRQNLAHLINRASYGGDRIVLVSHGEPKAAIIGIEELRRLEQGRAGLDAREERFRLALERSDRLRSEVGRWQETHQVAAESVEATLARLRENHDDELSSLR